MKIQNPTIPGFNPDPVILRVGKDYYVATSTFQFFPGVQIWHSTDLTNWTLVDRPLSRRSQLDLRGVEPGGGVQAPDLTYHNGQFHLVYTVVYAPTPVCMVVSTDKIGGEWSEPKYINSSGIDQSFFHEGDKTYVLTNEMISEKSFEGVFQGNDNRLFQGINIQEYDLEVGKLVGEPINIFKGTIRDITEAPHIYKKGEYYYLITAEGGTGYEHCVTICRSKDLYGPYEDSPYGPLLTAVDNKELYLQKSGHGSIAEDDEGNVWLSALATRPTKLGERNGSPFGRESILLKYRWTEDGWLENATGSNTPDKFIEVPFNVEQNMDRSFSIDFTKADKLPLQLWTVREPIEKTWANLGSNGLTLRGRFGITGWFEQSSIHKIWQSLNFEFSTKVTFDPIHYKQKAGIIQKYDEFDQIAFCIAKKYSGKKMLQLFQVKARGTEFADEIEIDDNVNTVWMKSKVDGKNISFWYSFDGVEYKKAEKEYPIEDLFEQNTMSPGYTGAVVGIFASDEYNLSREATFEFFEYKENQD